MKTRVIALLLCVLSIFTLFSVVACAATEQAELEITIDVNKRYTDILYPEEVNDPLLELDSNKKEMENKRNIYVTVLVVLLVIAIGILIYTLKKAPSEDSLKASDDKETPKTTIKIKVPKNRIKNKLEGEEKKQ